MAATSRGDHIRLPVGEVVKNRYEVIEEIGCGNFSKVYRCYDRSRADLKERKRFPVAMKVLKREYKKDAAFEKRMLRILEEKDVDRTARVSKMIESFEWQDCPVFIMPIHGPSVRSRRLGINRGVVTRPLLIEFAYDILETIDFVHFKCRMVHTDLKPENILISDVSHMQDKSLGENWVICDFGSASLWRMEKLDSDLISTRPYRAPEVVLGNKWFYAADMWSIGCILYEVAVGHRLFEVRDDNTHLQMMEKRIGRLPESLRRHAKYSSRYFSAKGDFLIVSDVVRNGRCRLTPLTDMFRHDPAFLRLLQGLLSFEPMKRMTAAEALAEPIFKELRRQRNGEVDSDADEQSSSLNDSNTSPLFHHSRQRLSEGVSRHRGPYSPTEGTASSLNPSNETSGLDEQPSRKYADPNSLASRSASSFSPSPVTVLTRGAGATPEVSSHHFSTSVRSTLEESVKSHPNNTAKQTTSKSAAAAAAAAATAAPEAAKTVPTTGHRTLNSSYYKTAKPCLSSTDEAALGDRTSKPIMRSLSACGKPTAAKAKVSRSSSMHSKTSAPHSPRGLPSVGGRRPANTSGSNTPRTPRGRQEGGSGGKDVRREPGASPPPTKLVVKGNPPATRSSPRGNGAVVRPAKGSLNSLQEPPRGDTASRGGPAKSTASTTSGGGGGGARAADNDHRPPTPSVRERAVTPRKAPSRTSSAASKHGRRVTPRAKDRHESPLAASTGANAVFQRQPTTPRGRGSQPSSNRVSRSSSLASLSSAPPLLNLAPRDSTHAGGGRPGVTPRTAGPTSVVVRGNRVTRPAGTAPQDPAGHLGGSVSGDRKKPTEESSSLRGSLRVELGNAASYKSPGVRTPRSNTPTNTSEKHFPNANRSSSATRTGRDRVTPSRKPQAKPERGSDSPPPPPPQTPPPPPSQEHAATREVREFRQSTTIDATDQAVLSASSNTPRTTAAANNRLLKPRMSLRFPSTTDRRQPFPAAPSDRPSVNSSVADLLHASAASGRTNSSVSLVGGSSVEGFSLSSVALVPAPEVHRSEAAVPEGSVSLLSGLRYPVFAPGTPNRNTLSGASFSVGSPCGDDYNSPVRVREIDASFGSPISATAAVDGTPRGDRSSAAAAGPVTGGSSSGNSAKGKAGGKPESSSAKNPTPTPATVTTGRKGKPRSTSPDAVYCTAAPAVMAASRVERSYGSDSRDGSSSVVVVGEKAPRKSDTAKNSSPETNKTDEEGGGGGGGGKQPPQPHPESGRSGSVKKSNTVVHPNPRSIGGGGGGGPALTSAEAPAQPKARRRYFSGPIPPTAVTQRSKPEDDSPAPPPPPRIVVADVSRLQSLSQKESRGAESSFIPVGSTQKEAASRHGGSGSGSTSSLFPVQSRPHGASSNTDPNPSPVVGNSIASLVSMPSTLASKVSPQLAVQRRPLASPMLSTGKGSPYTEVTRRAKEEEEGADNKTAPHGEEDQDEPFIVFHVEEEQRTAEPAPISPCADGTAVPAKSTRERSGSLSFKDPPSSVRPAVQPRPHASVNGKPSSSTATACPKGSTASLSHLREKYIVPRKANTHPLALSAVPAPTTANHHASAECSSANTSPTSLTAGASDRRRSFNEGRAAALHTHRQTGRGYTAGSKENGVLATPKTINGTSPLAAAADHRALQQSSSSLGNAEEGENTSQPPLRHDGGGGTSDRSSSVGGVEERGAHRRDCRTLKRLVDNDSNRRAPPSSMDSSEGGSSWRGSSVYVSPVPPPHMDELVEKD